MNLWAKIYVKRWIAPTGTPVACSQPHENCAFRASVGLHTFFSGSGRSPILVVGRSFRRCDQSRKYVPPETARPLPQARGQASRSEEHTSELQSLTNLVCRLLLEKKKQPTNKPATVH